MKSKLNLASWKPVECGFACIRIESDAGLGGASVQVTMPRDGNNNPRITYGSNLSGLGVDDAYSFAKRIEEATSIAIEWKCCADAKESWEACGQTYELA